MQVILTQDIRDLGQAGQMVAVKRGYGSNFLIPQGMAVLATPRNRSRMEHEQRKIEAQIARERSTAAELGKRLAGLSVTLTRLVGEDDKIFGSVTNKDITDALADEGVKIDRRQVELEAPLKSLGVYEVPVRLHREVTAIIKVWVVAD
ncbi:MAG: 50S ribosomal protein L9 [Deltaproteobacteria bacterium HGW-Deltaproteobacteria-14]|jgi:large subunit ribosomal protein L9|nr:MAG: 50S ribosomal protein L9 [Deltaproteobacteria bacterium HGW-Deltaproteobacteria-14]